MADTIIDELRFTDKDGNTYTANLDRLNFVHLTGDESITGRKTFNDIPLVPNYNSEIHPESSVVNVNVLNDRVNQLKDDLSSGKEILENFTADQFHAKENISIEVQKDSTSSDGYNSNLDFTKDDKTLSEIYNTYNNVTNTVGLRVYGKDDQSAELYVEIDNNGISRAYGPTPPQRDNSNSLATTEYVNTKLRDNYVPLDGSTSENPIRGTLYYNDKNKGEKLAGAVLRTCDDSHYFEISGGYDCPSGANLQLYGNNHSDFPGYFRLFVASDGDYKNLIGKPDGTLTWDGSFNAETVYSAVFNDYAEFFEKGEDVSEGDIIALTEDEKYGKATIDSKVIIGVYSKDPAMIVGGEKNLAPKEQKNYIPVALSGRVFVKVLSKPELGDYITVSETPGVGKPVKEKDCKTVGQVVSVKDFEETGMVRIFCARS